MRTTDEKLNDVCAPWGKPRLLPNKYPSSRCSGCGGGIGREDEVAYFGAAPHGMRTWHPACVAMDAAALGVQRMLALTEQSQRKVDTAATKEILEAALKERSTANKEAAKAVLHWLHSPGMDRLRETVIELIRELPRSQAPAEPSTPSLRLVR